MKRSRFVPLLLAACLATALSASPSAPSSRGGEPALPEQEVARLVRDLGSADFNVREAAARRLLKWETPPPALRAALTSSDREVARRAARIIAVIARREENVAFAKLSALARRGEIDRLVELLVRRPKWEDEDACWQVVAKLCGKLCSLERSRYGDTSHPSSVGYPGGGDFPRYVRMQQPQRVATRRAALKHRHYVVRAEQIASIASAAGAGFSNSLLVSSRDTRTHSLMCGVVLAGGPVEVEGMNGSIIVCDGSVKCCDAGSCLIIARGDVQIRGYAKDCRIITAGSVHFLPNKVLDGLIPRRQNVEIKEHEPNPLGFVRWFDPARVGITVESAAGGVRVKAAGKSFAAAGLRAGDLLTALDGEALKSPDDFRLLLRAKLADGGKMALAVRRAGQDLKIPVRCKD